MKSIIAALLATVATPGPLSAQVPEIEAADIVPAEKSPNEMDQVMALFANIFDTSKLPPPEPARLTLAEVTAAKLLPDGTYTRIIDEMMGQILAPMFNMMPGLSDVQISLATGASDEAVAALSEEDKVAVTEIIDPYHKKRGEQFMDVIKPAIAEAMTIIEPAMRKGLTRAYARKFTVIELGAINGFFSTPVGAAFARESFALQADPEVMQATFKALPEVINRFMSGEANFKTKFEELPKQRQMAELSDAELQKLASVLGVTVQSLKSYSPAVVTEPGLPVCAQDGDESDCTDEDWAAGDTVAAAAAAVVAAETEAFEKMRSAWSKADLKTVEEAEAAQAAIWARHDKIDQEMADAELKLQAAITAAKRNAGQPVDDEHYDDDADTAKEVVA